MPDWFYNTVARPALFQLPGELGRTVALGTIGLLGKTRLGGGVIDFLGHMNPDPKLNFEKMGICFPAAVGLGWKVDPGGLATAGLSRFGVGAIEVFDGMHGGVSRGQEELLIRGKLEAGKASKRLPPGAPPMLRRRRTAGNGEAVELPNGNILNVVRWDQNPERDALEGAVGIVLEFGHQMEDGGYSIPVSGGEALRQKVRDWRSKIPENAMVITAGGIADPSDAVALKQAGADLMLIDAGLVFRGPGLVKRCNDALLAGGSMDSPGSVSDSLFRQSWFWAAILGTALGVGGLAAIWLSFTRVLLPYDEHYIGVSHEFLRLGMPRLFDFMAHDRATLAGTMVGLGWLYLVIAVGGIRSVAHGARGAVIASALVGFTSFFSFFGFGYFDTLHAFVSLALLQLTIQIMVGDSPHTDTKTALIDNDSSSRDCALWGQLVWIIHSVGLLVAGIVILGIGMSSVFVAEDLAFLCMGREEIATLDQKLVSVVAHDRATLGGMLLAAGVATLLVCLWSFKRGARWVALGFLGLGIPAYASAIGVHFWVGYVDPLHLIPAFAGAGLWLAGLIMSWRYLHEKGSRTSIRIRNS